MKKFLSTILIIGIMSLTGCDNFSRPSGVWTCEELAITADFSLYVDLFSANSYTKGNGTIVINGETKRIITKMGFAGDAGVLYIFLAPEKEIVFDWEKFALEEPILWEMYESERISFPELSRIYVKDTLEFIGSGELLHKGGGCQGRWDAGKGVMYFHLQKRSANVPFDIDTYVFVKVDDDWSAPVPTPAA